MDSKPQPDMMARRSGPPPVADEILPARAGRPAKEHVPLWLPKKQAFGYKTPPDFPIKLHTLMLLSGTRGAGKGVATTSALASIKALGFADRIFWISDTQQSNREYLDKLGVKKEDCFSPETGLKAVIAEVEAEAAEWDEHVQNLKLYKLPASKLRKTDVDGIDAGLLERAAAAGLIDGEGDLVPPKSKYGHRPCLHAVIDDCMGNAIMSAGPRSPLVNLCIKHRHMGELTDDPYSLGLSLWVCVQSWSAQGSLPRPVRENCTGACIWFTPHEKQVDTMANELGGKRGGAEAFKAAYAECTKGDHDFLYVNKFPSDPALRYSRGWNEPLTDPAPIQA